MSCLLSLVPFEQILKPLAIPLLHSRLQGGVLNPNKKGLTELPRNVPNVPSGMFFSHNTNMVPPYRVLVDTNFINFSIQNKIDIENGMMFCLNTSQSYSKLFS
ncbi:PIN domain-like protein [Raphanus sativus]|nr:PIN domain-like protein [Raphanus sativus]